MPKRSERISPKEVLRDLVVKTNGGSMSLRDVLKCRSFSVGWQEQQIRGLLQQLRREQLDGEIWAMNGGIIYGLWDSLPPNIARKVETRIEKTTSGIAMRNMQYDGFYKRKRKERIAKDVLTKHINVLGQTVDSSLMVIDTLDELDNKDG